MEKSDLLKLVVVFVALIFVLSMFSYLGRGNGTTGATNTSLSQGTVIGLASATCRISTFSSELAIEPWTAELTTLANRLKSESKIEYTNIIGRRGVLILPTAGNATAVRNEFLDQNVSVTADAGCDVNGVANFTLQTGESRMLALSRIKITIDPYTQIGDELDLDVTADVDEGGIISMSAITQPRMVQAATTASLSCGNDYRIEATVPWEDRFLNSTELAAALEAPNESVKYQQINVVEFNRKLNSSEIESIKAENKSFVTNIIDEGLLTGSIDKEEITAFLAAYNVTSTFQPSQLVIELNSSERFDRALGILAVGEIPVSRSLRGCSLQLDKTLSVEGVQMLLTPGRRQLSYYLDIMAIPNNASVVDVLGNAYYAGRTVTDFQLLGTK